MPKYRKKPVVIDAWSVRDLFRCVENGKPLPEPIRKAYSSKELVFNLDLTIDIATLEGLVTAGPTDMVICGVQSELYPCKRTIFDATYERVEDEPEKSQTGTKDTWEELSRHPKHDDCPAPYGACDLISPYHCKERCRHRLPPL